MSFEVFKKKNNSYKVWSYGSVVSFNLETTDDDGGLLKVPRENVICHIGREELKEYIEVLNYALKKKEAFEDATD